ncbi:MAG: PaaX family transcriptional regulator C-terminal domain-containing protein [Kiritimatiellia bacterium]|nr:PaaX family transcriptional regulator C-terminal domain-containing protein [Kiritimatiellia bacterium]
MKWESLHHPDWCPTVIRRRVAEQTLDLLALSFEAMTTRGRSVLMGSSYPSQTAYHAAVYRLRKAGLVAYRRTGGQMPELQLTTEGESRVSPACRRRPPWPRTWSGRWNLLAYDIPEKSRLYRNVLRAFLKKMRMGCLQKSVWVSAQDIRPEFDDLARAGGVDEFAYLFEARTVLGRRAENVVETAWKMSRLRERQKGYLSVYQENLIRAESAKCSPEELHALAHEELAAYVTIMESDPYLPRPLWPTGYLGERAWLFHREFGLRLALLLSTLA